MDEARLAQELAKAFANAGMLGKASGNPTDTYLYSEGGLFGDCKHDPVLINAMVGPMGYAGKLAWRGTRYENPIVHSLTYIGSSGFSQSTSCGSCGTPEIKRCAQSACFGRICQQTEEVLFDQIGLLANAGMKQVALYGNITDPMGNVLVRQGEVIENLFNLSLMAAAYNLRGQICNLVWTGNPASNSGGYEEFTGFDLLINTGHVDVLNGNSCDALDSYVATYSNQIIGATGSDSIVEAVTAMVRSLRYRIAGAGFPLAGTVIDIVMHPALWDCVSSAWACEYGLDCNVGASSTNDALAVAQLRDQFINGEYLTIDGMRYPVTLDNCISPTYTSIGNTNVTCSTIYAITRIIPGAPAVIDSPGNGIVTWGEYQDFNATGGQISRWVEANTGSSQPIITDGGRFAIAPQGYGGFCFDAKILTKPRLRMLMPWTSGRLTNVCCTPLGFYPDPTGSGGVYEVDGGSTDTPANYLYGDCFDAGTWVERGA